MPQQVALGAVDLGKRSSGRLHKLFQTPEVLLCDLQKLFFDFQRFLVGRLIGQQLFNPRFGARQFRFALPRAEVVIEIVDLDQQFAFVDVIAAAQTRMRFRDRARDFHDGSPDPRRLCRSESDRPRRGFPALDAQHSHRHGFFSDGNANQFTSCAGEQGKGDCANDKGRQDQPPR